MQPSVIRYHVRYWQWTWYALGLSGGLGLVGLALLLSLDVRSYIAQHQNSMVPGLSVDQNLLIAWLMVLFWGIHLALAAHFAAQEPTPQISHAADCGS